MDLVPSRKSAAPQYLYTSKIAFKAGIHPDEIVAVLTVAHCWLLVK